MRIKYRYLIYQALSAGDNAEASQKDVAFILREKIQQLFGDVGAGTFGASAILKLFDDRSKVFVVRVSRDHEMDVRVALCTVTELKKTPVVLRLLAVAGCTRTALDKLHSIFGEVAKCAQSSEESARLNAEYAALLSRSAL